MMRRALWCAAAVLLTATVTGASSLARAHEEAPALGQPAAGRTDIVLNDTALDLVTDSGGEPQRRYAIELAETAVTQRCMSARGLRWSGSVLRPAPGTDEDRALRMADRQRQGYGTAAGDGSPPDAGGPDPGPALFGDLDDVGQIAVAGLGTISYPRHGCLAQGYAAVYGDTATWARAAYLPQAVARTLGHAAHQDPRYLAALTHWRTCMATAGHRYADPDAVRVSVGRQQRSGKGLDRKAEIALAVTDARCNHTAGLFRTDLAVRRDTARTSEPGLRAEIAGLGEAQTAAAEQAHRLEDTP
jgi:hypothetical protein